MVLWPGLVAATSCGKMKACLLVFKHLASLLWYFWPLFANEGHVIHDFYFGQVGESHYSLSLFVSICFWLKFSQCWCFVYFA